MILSFTGHRVERLGDDLAGAWIAIKEFIMLRSPERVISGMATGVDTMAFDIAVELSIPVTAAVPWIGFVPGDGDRAAYVRRLEKAADVVVVSPSPTYHPGVYNERDRWMVDHSDELAAVWDGVRRGGTWYTMQYAKQVNRPVEPLKWRSK